MMLLISLIMMFSKIELQSSPVTIDNQKFPINISAHLECFEDKDGSLSLDQVRKPENNSLWKISGNESINLGYTQSVYWFRFTMEKYSAFQGRLLLELNFPTLDYVDFYYPAGSGVYGAVKTGDRRPFSSREISDGNFLFTVNPVPESGTFYLRVDNGGSLRFRAAIYSYSAFLDDRNIYLPFIWLIYGIIMFSALFYFFLFLYLRDRVYLLFSLFNMSIFLYQIALRGFAFKFLWPSYPEWANISPLFISCTMGIFSALFLRNILDTRNTNIFLHRCFSLFGIIIFPLLAVLSLLLSYHTVSLARYYTFQIYGILIFPTIAYYIKKGNRFAVYFLFSFLILMITNVFSTFMILGRLNSVQLAGWISDAGFIIIVVLSSLGLVDRFKSTTADLIDSRRSVDDKNKKLILANEELAATNEELEAMNEEFEAQNRELINSEKALIASEMELKDIFNSSNDAFIIYDMDGRILDVNKRMLDMYRVSRERALALSVSDISSSPVSVMPELRNWKSIMDGDEFMIELKALRPDDLSVFDVEVGLKNLKWRDKNVVLASIRDLSERKAAEAERETVRNQLVQAQKMEAVGTLAGGIAHDFNNILGGIIGSLNLLDFIIQKEKIENVKEIHEYLNTAVESSNRAADMTNQLLTLSRKSELNMKSVDIRDSLQHVMKICRGSFPKSVDLDFRYSDLPLYVLADQTQIDQAILNLCVNASHSMTLMREDGVKQGGQLAVEASILNINSGIPVIHPEASPDTSYVVITVKDTGVGINEEIRSRIFEPFFTTKPQDKGTGLGLAITYSIISQHGGFITIDSMQGEGSVFKIYLPQLGDIPQSVNENKPGIITGSGLVLIIDDEETILRVTSGMLKKCGYDVITADNPQKGIELFEENRDNINVIILDNSMPFMSGIEVYSVLKEIDPAVKVILCSGFIDDLSLGKAHKLGIVEFMNKPYNFEELSRRVREVILKTE